MLLKGLAEFGEETGPCAEGTCQHHRVLPVAQTYPSNFAIKRIEKNSHPYFSVIFIFGLTFYDAN